jgi:hypothetical protein
LAGVWNTTNARWPVLDRGCARLCIYANTVVTHHDPNNVVSHHKPNNLTNAAPDELTHHDSNHITYTVPNNVAHNEPDHIVAHHITNSIAFALSNGAIAHHHAHHVVAHHHPYYLTNAVPYELTHHDSNHITDTAPYNVTHNEPDHVVAHHATDSIAFALSNHIVSHHEPNNVANTVSIDVHTNQFSFPARAIRSVHTSEPTRLLPYVGRCGWNSAFGLSRVLFCNHGRVRDNVFKSEQLHGVRVPGVGWWKVRDSHQSRRL